MKILDQLFKGFSKLDYQQRLEALKNVRALSETEIEYLKKGGLKDIRLGEKFVENVIGYFQLPLGIATNFRIDGVDRIIPMAVEETSIVAAASKTAKWIRDSGEIKTSTIGSNIIGQIQFAKIKNIEFFRQAILQQKNWLIEAANREVAHGLVARGGGVRDVQVRILDRGEHGQGFDVVRESLATLEKGVGEFSVSEQSHSGFMGIVHILMDPCDAMGANIMNQVCEFLREPLERFTNEKVTMCILSNLVDSKITRAEVILDKIDPELAEKIEEASLFSQVDPYRAATNNKGVLNGIDPILIATGNDWRAVEAGVHAYASRSGQYRSITNWKRDGSRLKGVFEAPVITGTVGGVTTLHPTATMCLKMMGVQSANELSRVVAAVGLVQNLGALKALTTVGIIEGHMKLHIKNLSLGAGAEEKEIPLMQKRLEEILALKKRISLSHAVEVLKELRSQREGS